MLFKGSLTISASTTADDRDSTTFDIAKGVISKIMVRPRPGHAGLAHLVILHHETQIAPSVQGQDFSGDTFPIDWEEYYECYQPPFQLKLEGWNDDDTYPHTFDVFVAVLPKKAIVAISVVEAIKQIVSLISPRRIFTGRS